jgi:hypothetical protein
MAEYVCLDGRMSVNGICPASSYPGYQDPDENIVTPPVINTNKIGGDESNNAIPTKTFDQKYESIEDIPKKDYSKDVKSNFQWDFDKVGNKIQDFGTTVKSNIDAYDTYVEDNLGISKNVSNVFRAGAVVQGATTYGIAGVLAPFAIPFMAGGALNAKQKKENERITNITNQDTQGSNNTVDLATYGIPTYGDVGFNIHNDTYDKGKSVTGNSGTGSAGRGGASPGSTGAGGSDAMGSF